VARAEGDRPAGDPAAVDWDQILGELANQPIEEGWVTLEEAVSATGVSRSTLRSWYRDGRIPSRMVAGAHGPQRIVPLASVLDRALGSLRTRRQLERSRSVQAEVEELRRRVETIERHLGLN
jgi:predicted site-specific integrase-resolvase